MNLIIESIGRPIETDFSKTSVAHARNSVILANAIDADIVTCERDIHLADGKTYDNIICCYASPYMKYKKLIHIVRNNPNAKLWWFVNDHDLEDNILLRNVLKETKGERKIHMICNNERESYRGWIMRKKIKDEDGNLLGLLQDFIVEWHTLNLNAMIYSYEIPYKWEDKTRESIYYGTLRKWRLDDFLEYQKTGMTLSATTRTQKKFIENGVDQCPMVDKLSWQRGLEDLKKYKFSLYIEDEHTHDHYAHMANRFYEALMCNVITIFDKKCAKNLSKSGFVVPKGLIVNNAEEYVKVANRLTTRENFEKLLAVNERYKVQARREHDEVIAALQNIFCSGKVPESRVEINAEVDFATLSDFLM